MSEPIAIVGVGCRFPGSDTLAEYFRNILRKRCFITDIPNWAVERDIYLSSDPDEPLTSDSGIGAFLDKRPPNVTEFKIPPVAAAQMDRTQKLALVCARDALADAGYLERSFDRSRASVMIANSVGGRKVFRTSGTLELLRDRARLRAFADEHGTRDALDALLARYAEAYPREEINADTLPGESASLIAGRIAAQFDLHGPHFTIDSACASSMAAIWSGMLALRSGASDMVISGGVDTKVGPGNFVAFSKMTALSATGCFPFDARADGTVLGEGCAVMVLKRYADAVRDGDSIHALVLGCGGSSDGAGKGITAPNPDGQRIALRHAYEDAGVDPTRLHYVECHGTGTTVGDLAEIESVSSLTDARQQSLPIGSAKAMIGHAKAAAGAAGILRGLLAVNGRVVPPQVNFERATPELGDGLRVPTRAEPIDDEIVRVGVSAYGVGGTNFHVVLGTPSQNARAPLVRVDDYQLPTIPPLDNDTAFLFPGQGSQYVGMFDGCNDDPGARELIARAATIFGDLTGTSLLDRIDPATSSEAAMRETVVSQATIFLHAALRLRQLRRLDVEPGLVMGHSLGEYAALHAAGALTFEDGLQAVTQRGLEMAKLDTDGAMAFVASDAERVAALCAEVNGYVVVANLNSFEQFVVSGETDAVADVVARARAQKIAARRLNVSAAFHTRLVAGCIPGMDRKLHELTWSPTRVPVPSNVSRKVHPHASMTNDDRERTIGLLLQQISEPVDFIAQIELAYESGIRRFVEVGPKQILTGLVRDILRGKPFCALAVDGRDPRDVPAALAKPVGMQHTPLRTSEVRYKKTGSAIDLSRPVHQQVRQVVADVSGYELTEIGDDDEFESDLGIDTLKIFEIFFRLQGSVFTTESGSFRNLTSVAKLVAATKRATPQRETDEEVIQCFRYRTETTGSLTHLLPISPKRRYRVITPDGSAYEKLHDPASDDTLILEPLPQSGAALAKDTIPALTQRLVACAIAAADKQRRPNVHIVTVSDPSAFNASAHRAIGGLTKSAQCDIPELAITYDHIDAAQPDEDSLRRLLAADPCVGRRITADGAIQQGYLELHEPSSDRVDWAELLGPDDTVLVTGGLGGIASRIIRGLLPRVLARFKIAGRRPHADAWVADEGRGRVDYVSVDLADEAAVRAVKWGPITLVVHAAGAVEQSNLKVTSRDQMDRVFGPKVLGLEHLLACLDESSLRGVVCFSSISGFVGAHGIGDYAAANGFLDGFKRDDLPVLSIGWGPWATAGMAATDRLETLLRSEGWNYVPMKLGITRFEQLLAQFLRAPGPVSHHNYVVFARTGALRDRVDPLFRKLDG